MGPSLTSAGVSGVLADPTLTIVNSSGTTVASNDNWASDTNASAVQSTGLAPSAATEAAIMRTLSAGAYTAIVQGASNSTGVALVEVYAVN